jgi:hypothetical protein
MINTSVVFAAYLPIRVSPQSAPLECFLKRKPSHGSQQYMASLRLAGALCKRLCGSRTPIASGKVTGADDRFGVLAYEGVGLGHFAACAVRPFDTSGRTGWVFGGRWPFDTSGRTGGCLSGTGPYFDTSGRSEKPPQGERDFGLCERGEAVRDNLKASPAHPKKHRTPPPPSPAAVAHDPRIDRSWRFALS